MFVPRPCTLPNLDINQVNASFDKGCSLYYELNYFDYSFG